MRLLLSSKNLNNPSEETLYTYIQKRFAKIGSFLQKTNLDGETVETKIKAEYYKNKKLFDIKAVLSIGGKAFVVKISDKDMRRAIDSIVENLRMQLIESRGKSWLNYHS